MPCQKINWKKDRNHQTLENIYRNWYIYLKFFQFMRHLMHNIKGFMFKGILVSNDFGWSVIYPEGNSTESVGWLCLFLKKIYLYISQLIHWELHNIQWMYTKLNNIFSEEYKVLNVLDAKRPCRKWCSRTCEIIEPLLVFLESIRTKFLCMG